MRLVSLHRYPVKGLRPEALARILLSPGQGVALDRAFAFARPGVAFDPAQPKHLPKQNFLMLMREEELAGLSAIFSETSNELILSQDARELARGDPTTPEGRRAIETVLAQRVRNKIDGWPKLVSAPGHSFGNVAAKVVSLIGLASIRALQEKLGAFVDPLRFRANAYFDGAPPWAELGWIDREVRIGPARLRIRQRTDRCAATNVDPKTGARDMNIPKALARHFGHMDMGVYAEVIEGGEIKIGDVLALSLPTE
jgi:uncharacterized protein YcbX